jgi:hypothetical protein
VEKAVGSPNHSFFWGDEMEMMKWEERLKEKERGIFAFFLNIGRRLAVPKNRQGSKIPDFPNQQTPKPYKHHIPNRTEKKVRKAPKKLPEEQILC